MWKREEGAWFEKRRWRSKGECERGNRDVEERRRCMV
jgi:hypothetical protein